MEDMTMIRELGSVKTETKQPNQISDLDQVTPPEFFN